MAKNESLIIKTPKKTTFVDTGKSGTVASSLGWSAGFGAAFSEQLQAGQRKIDREVMLLLEPFLPAGTEEMGSSMLRATQVGSGCITIRTPNARKAYYSKSAVGSTAGALRGPHAFQRMKASKSTYLTSFARKAVGSK